MKLNRLSFLQALVITACQSQTQDTSFSYIENQTGDLLPLSQLIDNAYNEVIKSKNVNSAAYHVFENALVTIRPVLENECALNQGFILKIKQVWWRLWGVTYSQKMNAALDDKEKALSKVQYFTAPLLLNMPHPPQTPHSYLSALSQFMREFKNLFGTTPRPLKGGEICKFFLIAKKIWASMDVYGPQKTYEEKYTTFQHLMTEYVIGSHMAFEETVQEGKLKGTLALQLMAHVGLEHSRGKIRSRKSSHYNFEGRNNQWQIEGSMFPAWLFDHAYFGYDPEANKIASHKGVTKYYDQLPDKIKVKYQKTKFTWGQNENTPFSTGFFNSLAHTLDTIHYLVLRYVCRSSRPQIAPYKSQKLGRGLPDSNPVIVRKAHTSLIDPEFYSHNVLTVAYPYRSL